MNTFTFRPAPPVDGEYAGDLEDLHRLLQHDDELAHDDRLEEHHSACPRTCPRKGFQRALQRIRRRSDGEEDGEGDGEGGTIVHTVSVYTTIIYPAQTRTTRTVLDRRTLCTTGRLFHLFVPAAPWRPPCSTPRSLPPR